MLSVTVGELHKHLLHLHSDRNLILHMRHKFNPLLIEISGTSSGRILYSGNGVKSNYLITSQPKLYHMSPHHGDLGKRKKEIYVVYEDKI